MFKLRSRMIDIKNNFKSKYTGNLLCTFFDKEEETPKDLLKCMKVIEELKIDDSVKADDIYKDFKHQIKAVKVWKKILNMRTKRQ